MDVVSLGVEVVVGLGSYDCVEVVVSLVSYGCGDELEWQSSARPLVWCASCEGM